MLAHRVGPLLLCALWPLSSALAPTRPQEVETAEDTCTAWTLDITNLTRFELQVYVFRGDTAVAPAGRNRGHLIRFIGPRGRGSTLLFDARPAVMIYAFQQAADAQFQAVVDSTGNMWYEEVAPNRPERTWLLEVASPGRDRWPRQVRRVGLKFSCLEEPGARGSDSEESR
jgi:hypothetical protein